MIHELDENAVWGYVLAYGYVCVDLRIENTEEGRSIHGIIQFIDDPGYKNHAPHIRKKQIEPFDVTLYDRIVIEDTLDPGNVGMRHVRRKILGIELQANEAAQVSLDNEHYKFGYLFKAHGVLNLPRTVEEAQEWGMPPGPSPDPPLVTTKGRVQEMVDLCEGEEGDDLPEGERCDVLVNGLDEHPICVYPGCYERRENRYGNTCDECHAFFCEDHLLKRDKRLCLLCHTYNEGKHKVCQYQYTHVVWTHPNDLVSILNKMGAKGWVLLQILGTMKHRPDESDGEMINASRCVFIRERR